MDQKYIDTLSEFMENFEACKDRIVFRLCNRDRNQMWLASAPHRDIFDFSMSYQVILDKDWNGEDWITSFQIMDDILERWGVDAGTVMFEAAYNTPRLFPLKVINPLDAFPHDSDVPDIGARVITNEAMFYGTAAIFYEGAFDQIQNEIGDYYIVPCSVHETLAIPMGKVNPTKILRAIPAANALLDPGYVLSNNLYQYTKTYGFDIC